MLTGDNEVVANIVANSLGITNVISNVLPKDKAKVISDLKLQNKKVMIYLRTDIRYRRTLWKRWFQIYMLRLI